MKKKDNLYWKILEQKGYRERYQNEKNFIHRHRNDIGRCPYCNGNIKDRKISMWKELVFVLYKVYVWCGKNRKHEFQMKEVRHFMNKSEYACFNNFVRFGGIVYRPKNKDGKSEKALYGINMARAKEFFEGKRQIPAQITLDQITGEIVEEVRCSVDEFPELKEFIGEDGLFDYEKPVQGILLKDESHS